MPAKLLFAACAALVVLPFAARADEPITLKFATASPQGAPHVANYLEPWMARINKDGEGAVVMKPFYSGTLASLDNVYDRILNGVVETGTGLQGMVGGKFPGTSVADLPLVAEKARDSAAALWALYEKGLLAEEYAAVRPLNLFVYPQISLHFRKRVQTLDEVKGLKLSVSDRVASETMTKLGAAPVTMGPPDIYPSLSRGVIDGAAIQWTGILPFKLHEVTTHHVTARLGSSSAFILMNKDAYAKLPAKAKAAIDKNSGYVESRNYGIVLDKQADDSYAFTSKQPGHTLTTFGAKDEERMYKMVEPVLDEWVKRTPNGQALLAAFKAEVARSAATQ